MRRRAVSGVVALVVVAIVAVVAVNALSSSTPRHRLTAYFQSATNLVSGANVTAGGETVGTVGPITLQNGLAAVQLDITNQSVWPLHVGTQAEIRWGGTVSYSNRYVELLPGPARDPVLADGAKLPTQDTVTPVEFDQFFDTFDPKTRAALGGLATNGAATFGGRSTQLHDGIDATAPALTSVSNVLQQLGEDPNALETLISAGSTTAQALHAQQPQLVSLVADAANTFQTIADNAHATQTTLSKLSPALDSAQTALHRLDPTLGKLNTLVDEIHPGAVQLNALAGPLASTLTELRTVAPQLNRTLAAVGSGAPKITRLLTTAKPVFTSATSALKTFEPMAACLLPYAPEFAGFVETWDSFLSGVNAAGHYARALFQAFPDTNDGTETPATLASTPGVGYALIRPPGYGDDGTSTSTFDPACGVTPAGLDAADDPEHP